MRGISISPAPRRPRDEERERLLRVPETVGPETVAPDTLADTGAASVGALRPHSSQ
jgi:hypothetical protein